MADSEQLKSLSTNSDISADIDDLNSTESETERNEDTQRQDTKCLSDGNETQSEGNVNKQHENSKTVDLEAYNNTKITDDDANDEHEQLTSSQYDSNVNGSETELNRQDFTESHSDHHKISENTSPQDDKQTIDESHSSNDEDDDNESDDDVKSNSEGKADINGDQQKDTKLRAGGESKCSESETESDEEDTKCLSNGNEISAEKHYEGNDKKQTEYSKTLNPEASNNAKINMKTDDTNDEYVQLTSSQNDSNGSKTKSDINRQLFTESHPLKNTTHRELSNPNLFPWRFTGNYRNQFPPYPVEEPFRINVPPYPINELETYQNQQIPNNIGSVYHQQYYLSTYQTPSQQFMPNPRHSNVQLIPSAHSPLADAKYYHHYHHESHPTNSNQIPNSQNSNNGPQSMPYETPQDLRNNSDPNRQYSSQTHQECCQSGGQNYSIYYPDPNRQYSNYDPQSILSNKNRFNDPNHRNTAPLISHSSSEQTSGYEILDDPPVTPQFQIAQDWNQSIANSKQVDQQFYQPGVQLKHSSEEPNKEFKPNNKDSQQINQTLGKNVEKPTPEDKRKHPSNPSCEDASFQDTNEPCSEKNDTPKQKLFSNSKDCEKKSRNVLVKILQKDSHLTKEKLEMSFRKKNKGGDIEQVKFNSQKNSVLVIFKDLVTDNFLSSSTDVAGVPVKLSFFHKNTDKFHQDQTLDIPIEQKYEYTVKHMIQDKKLMKQLKKRLRIEYTFNSFAKDKDDKLMLVLELGEFVDDLDQKKMTAKQILISLLESLTQKSLNVPDGINLKLKVKEMNQLSSDLSLFCKGNTIQIISSEFSLVEKHLKELKGLIQKNQDDMNDKQHTVVKITFEPIESRYFRKYLLESVVKRANKDISIDFQEDGIILKGRYEDLMFMKSIIYESTDRKQTLNICDGMSIVAHFFAKTRITQILEDKINQMNVQCCVGLKMQKPVVMTINETDASTAKQFLENVLTVENIKLNNINFMKTNEWQMLVRSLESEFGEKFCIQTDPRIPEMAMVAFKEIAVNVKEQIEDYLGTINVKTEHFFDDENCLEFIRRYMVDEIDKIVKTDTIKIDYLETPWKITGSDKNLKICKPMLAKLCQKVQKDTVLLKFTGIAMLFPRRGGDIIAGVMKETKCLIIEGKLFAKQKQGLLQMAQWILPNSTRIEVIKGDIRLLSVGAIVNAANRQMLHGSGLAGAILKMGGNGIQKECSQYIKDHGELSDGEAIVSSPGRLTCKKIIHTIGPMWKDGQQNESSLLKKAVLSSLEVAVKNNLDSIAIPAISTGIFGYPLKNACKIIVKTICDYLNESKNNIKLVILCDINEETLNAFCNFLKKELGEMNMKEEIASKKEEEIGAVGGAAASDSEDDDGDEDEDTETSDSDVDAKQEEHDGDESDYGSENSYMSLVMSIISGELDKQKVDVLVNCTSAELNLKSGAVSRAILNRAGQSIQTECDKKYAGGVSPGEVAITSGGKLSCSKIFHGCILSYTKEKREAEKVLERFVKNCLIPASKAGFTSIAFPALGCGRLGFPADISAKIIFQTTQNFMKKQPQSSLKKVLFVIHPNDTSVFKAFREIGEEFGATVDSKKNTNKSRSSAHSSSINIGKLNIQICQGDLTKETTDCIVNVCSSSMELKYGISKLISDRAGPELAEECAARKGQMRNDGIVITEAGELQCSAICHLKIQKTFSDWRNIIKNAMYKMNKEDITSVSFPAIGTGGLKVSAKESAEFLKGALESFADNNKYPKIQDVRIVIFQEEHLKDFQNVFGEKRKSENTYKHATQGSKKKKKKNNNKDKITLTIYADSEVTIKDAKNKLIDRFKDETEDKLLPSYLKHDIEKLGKTQLGEIKEMAANFHVNLKYHKTDIILSGLTKQVHDCHDQIVERFQEWRTSKQRMSEKAMISKYVDWQYEEKPDGKRRSFGQGISCMLEKAKVEKKKEVMFKDQKGREYTINLKKMLEYSQKGSPVKIFRMDKGMKVGSALIKGEKEALAGTKTVYFKLVPKRSFDDSKPEEYHFRLAESQFCRLLNTSGQYYVTEVEYVVNPTLHKSFRDTQLQLKSSHGENSSLPVLAFHGTNANNIQSICENGFKKPGDNGFSQKHGSKYGNGVYFSEFPDYSMGYIQGASKLLLCKVLLGKSYTCTGLRSQSQVQPGYDSHASADKKELVVFKTDRILPCYIVHYSQKSGDYKYSTP